MKLFEDTNIVSKRDFGDGRARYEEIQGDEDHHHHLIDVRTGEVIEFYNEELENLKVKIANELGYELVDHHLELFGSPISKKLILTVLAIKLYVRRIQLRIPLLCRDLPLNSREAS